MNQQAQKITAQQFFDQKRAQALASHMFPNESIQIGFKEVLHKALLFNSVQRIQAHQFTWSNMIRFERPFQMVEMNLCLEILKAATPKEMNQTLEENLEMLNKIVVPMEKKWIEIDEILCEPIMREIQTKQKLIVPPGHEVFKAVKGEA